MGLQKSEMEQSTPFVSCELNAQGGCYCSQACDYMVGVSHGSSSVFMNMQHPSNSDSTYTDYDTSQCYSGFPTHPIYHDIVIEPYDDGMDILYNIYIYMFLS
jgi:hypothetical protein